MAKKKIDDKKYPTEEVFESLDHTAQQSEHFLEKNSKLLAIVFGVILLAVLGYFAYLKFVKEPQNLEARQEIATADQMFEQDSMQMALNGSPGAFMGYNDIIEDYGSSDVANIAKYKAAIASYKTGDYQQALDYIESFNTKEVVLKAMKAGVKGDILVQLGKKEEGLDAYENAIKDSELSVIQQVYTKKAAVLAMDLGQYERGLKIAENFLRDNSHQDSNGEIAKMEEMLKYAAQNGNGK